MTRSPVRSRPGAPHRESAGAASRVGPSRVHERARPPVLVRSHSGEDRRWTYSGGLTLAKPQVAQSQFSGGGPRAQERSDIGHAQHVGLDAEGRWLSRFSRALDHISAGPIGVRVLSCHDLLGESFEHGLHGVGLSRRPRALEPRHERSAQARQVLSPDPVLVSYGEPTPIVERGARRFGPIHTGEWLRSPLLGPRETIIGSQCSQFHRRTADRVPGHPHGCSASATAATGETLQRSARVIELRLFQLVQKGGGGLELGFEVSTSET
jgi:hypothetical protein